MINSGIRIFRINGAYFNSKEYKPLVNILTKILAEINETPTIIFDLKGPIPRVSKLFNSKQSISVEKGQIIKIKDDTVKGIMDENMILLDKSIVSCLKIGDNLFIDGSKCILKVIAFERDKHNENYFSNVFENYLSEKLPSTELKNDTDFLFQSTLLPINEQNELFKDEEGLFQGFKLNFFEGESTEVIKDGQNCIEDAFKSIVKSII